MRSTYIFCLLTAALTAAVTAHECHESALLCHSAKNVDNCNITRYHQYLAITISNIMINFEQRLPIDTLRHSTRNDTDYCYIEAILDRKGNLLFIRFASKRSLLTGNVADPGWDRFNSTMAEFDNKEDGMQMLMDLDGLQICPQLPASRFLRREFTNRVLARFTERSAICHTPLERYTRSKFTIVEFESKDSLLLQMQPIVTTNSIDLNLSSVLKLSRTQPLSLWIYKCRKNVGYKNKPCNEEVNAFLFLRQWINSTGQGAEDDDYYSDSKWRHMFLMADIPLIVLMSAASSYIAIHITCMTWIALAKSSSKMEF